jgi:hypothetical protein
MKAACLFGREKMIDDGVLPTKRSTFLPVIALVWFVMIFGVVMKTRRQERKTSLARSLQVGFETSDAGEDEGDPVEYVNHHHDLYNISSKQSFIGSITGPFQKVDWNMAFSLHSGDAVSRCFNLPSVMMFLFTDANGHGSAKYFFTDTLWMYNTSSSSSASSSPSIVQWGSKPLEFLQAQKEVGNTGPGGDWRLFKFRGSLYTTFVGMSADRLQCLYLGELIFNCTTKKLFLDNVYRLATEHELGRHHEKNWAAWEYRPPSKNLDVNKNKTDSESESGHYQNMNNKTTVNTTTTTASRSDSAAATTATVKTATTTTTTTTTTITTTTTTTTATTTERSYNDEVLLFSHSVIPHRVVHANETKDTSPSGSLYHFDRTRRAHTVALTEVVDPPSWPWGPLHGGTNAILIETAHGPRYVSFFHSQHKWMASWCLTYFMGAYLFRTEPPFDITHISSEPIIPKKLYKASTSGWAFRAIDFIIFPMSIQLIKRDQILLSLGRNDREGWTIALNLTSLVSSLTPVTSRVLLNRFDEHFAFQHTHP